MRVPNSREQPRRLPTQLVISFIYFTKLQKILTKRQILLMIWFDITRIHAFVFSVQAHRIPAMYFLVLLVVQVFHW